MTKSEYFQKKSEAANSNTVCRSHDSKKLQKQHRNGPVVVGLEGANQYKDYQTDRFLISVRKGNNCFEIDGTFVQVVNILERDESVYVAFKALIDTGRPSLFRYPCDSQQFGIKVVSGSSIETKICSVAAVAAKCVLLPSHQPDEFVVMPLLHQ